MEFEPERFVMARVVSGEVQLDTHNAYGYMKLADTKINRKLYPNAEEKDGELLISTDEQVYTVPSTGTYEVTTGTHYAIMSNLVELEKGHQLYFSKDGQEYLEINKVK